jgi:hypothetical protein
MPWHVFFPVLMATVLAVFARAGADYHPFADGRD